MKFTSSLKLKLIYVFRINDPEHKGCLKIGEATSDDQNIWGLEPNSKALNEAARKRINQYTQTAGIRYELLYTELAVYSKNGVIHSFSDAEVHNVLTRSGVQRKTFDTQNKANEWFVTDLETVKKAITAVKEGRQSLNTGEITHDRSPIVFRPEQREAIDKTKKQFRNSNEMLWYAKMRFGKTLSALQVVKEMNFTRTLILTHRPVVDAGWFKDFGKIFYDRPEFSYGSKNNGHTFETLEQQCQKGECKYVYFASMQDLRGSELVGGNFDKNDEVFATPWDLIIVDEAHEGTQTELGKAVMQELVKPETKVLRLSGTPFNLLDDFKEEEIYTWDYVMEQRAKADWDKIHFGDPNPYAELPRLNIFTYDLGKLLPNYADEDLAFNFHEFFRVNADGQFIHEKDVYSFLNLISKKDEESNYPYSTDEYRDNFRHSLWMVPGVKEARALSAMLKKHPVFSQFTIVNVAGEGDEEEANEDALKKVQNAIGDHPEQTYTITLSCGRLTTGVSVPEWTAVFMLAGSYNTSATSYMQTIFRVQTPAKINGRIKEECFVFDFAPDRTLKVIAETAKISAKAGKTTMSDRETMGEFLNFCPIIAIEGSRMKTYNVNGMLEQLKKVYVERVVRNGFEDGYLYNNDQLMQLEEVELKDFDGLKKIIGSTKAMPKSGDIDLNKQGFTNEEYEQLENIEQKKRKREELTEEEKRLLAEKVERKKNRDTAVSILRGISIRMPLLIYGADVNNEDVELTIDNFTHLIDDQSWEEFMPRGVTKEVFEKFKKYYEPDVFRAAGKRIRAMARAADKVSVEERIGRITTIFNTFRNPDKETVLTPWRVVNMHLGDCVGGYVFYDEAFEHPLEEPRFVDQGEVTKEVFAPDARILEINSKSGLYPLYMTYGIYRSRLKAAYPDGDGTPEQQMAVWDQVVAENIFVICKTPMAKSITKRTLVGFRKAKVNTRYFEDLINQITNKSATFVEKVKQGKTYWKSNNDDNMKFNAIVGNPPYQVMDGGTDRGAIPVYQHFVSISKKLLPDYISMIMPARWYAGGRGLDAFREDLLKDKRMVLLVDYETSKSLFPTVDIAGGLCYFLWSKKHNGLCSVINTNVQTEVKMDRNLNEFNVFIRSNAAIPILKKVISNSDSFLNEMVFPINPFGFRTYFRGREQKKEGDIKILTSAGWRYIRREEIRKNKDLIDKYKILVGRFVPNNGELNVKPGEGYRVITSPQILNPNEINTETYIDVAILNTKEEALNYSSYLNTKFARFLLRQSISSVNVTKECFSFIPLQDFTSASDIDWSRPIADIDRQLYVKYGLTDEEIAFIESMIKPME
ncbi:Eco57I restriction-modification methylase domain-containing protein [Anaerorudis cellulosivorans]|uniref:Eco57I restriction-modification methylase domain-containing protein n=1 Tax=Anaerorudis cellulosivorans TaxID=3397862 RepID=UPI00221E5E96|nr:Eco57I restriction-modification methylase domain-containing protein [Seramator thermalis]MCW1734099.1 Eco57I restriction-modification methylase domain-containing protein [Seramator thermalis]